MFICISLAMAPFGQTSQYFMFPMCATCSSHSDSQCPVTHYKQSFHIVLPFAPDISIYCEQFQRTMEEKQIALRQELWKESSTMTYMTHSQMWNVDAWVTDLLWKLLLFYKCGFKKMMSSLSQNLTTYSVHTFTCSQPQIHFWQWVYGENLPFWNIIKRGIIFAFKDTISCQD